tara:strand:- start:430 stop:579 length:150 start_codon:yes stop_codon:yes gene_type:complete
MKQKQGIAYDHCRKKQTMKPVAFLTLVTGKNTDPNHNISNGKKYSKEYG